MAPAPLDALAPSRDERQRTTVIILSHNYGRYLNWCIQSVLAQTSRPARILVIDDASDDNTEEVARRFSPRVEYYRVEFRNAQESRNFGLCNAISEYVIFLDADDFMSERMLEELETALDGHPDARVAYCDKYVFGDAAAMQRLRLPYHWVAADFSVLDLQFKNFIMLTSLVRREFLTGFDERIRRLQDWDTWLGILKSDKHAVHVPVPLLHYRVHGHNLSFRRKELIEHLKVMAKHRLIQVEQIGVSPSLKGEGVRGKEVVVFAMAANSTNVAHWHELAQRIGCKVRAIIGMTNDADAKSQNQEAVTRARDVILQTVWSDSLDDLLWRFTGVVSNPDIAGVWVLRNLADSSNLGVFRQGTEPVVWSSLSTQDIMASSSLEELGTFALSPEAARLLLYLKPAPPASPVRRLTNSARAYYSRHIGWRFSGAKS